MSEQHTSGPWEYSAAGAQVFANNGQTHIADVRGYGALQYEGEEIAVARMDADGRLLAAAPDLLSCVEATMRILDAWGPDRRGMTLELLHQKLSKVLVKAKGTP